MIYKTLSECLEECKKTGVLKIEGMTNDEYTLKGAGLRPRLVTEFPKPAFLSTFH